MFRSSEPITRLVRVLVVRLTTTPDEVYVVKKAGVVNISDTNAEINPRKHETPQLKDKVTPKVEKSFLKCMVF